MRWLLIGHYGGSNTGDEAMLLGLLRGTDMDKRVRFTVVTRGGKRPAARADAPIEVCRASIGPVLTELFRSDGVVLGGGTHFHDDYVGLRAMRHLRYMLRFVAISALGRMLGKKVVWLGMGFGPFHRRVASLTTRIGLFFCHCVTTRDEASYREVERWVSPERLVRSFDLAALLVEDGCATGGADTEGPGRHEPSRATATGPGRREAARTLAINVTEAHDSRTWEEDQASDLWRAVTEALGLLLVRHPDTAVRIYVFRGGEREGDGSLSHRFLHELQGEDPERVSLMEFREDPTEMLADMSTCDAAVVTRYHGAVFAYLAELPAVFVAYHRKLQDLAAELGKDTEASVVHLSQQADAEQLYDRFSRALAGDARYQARLPLSSALERARTSIDVLESQTGRTP